jgi:hypothetical protein
VLAAADLRIELRRSRSSFPVPTIAALLREPLLLRPWLWRRACAMDELRFELSAAPSTGCSSAWWCFGGRGCDGSFPDDRRNGRLPKMLPDKLLLWPPWPTSLLSFFTFWAVDRLEPASSTLALVCVPLSISLLQQPIRLSSLIKEPIFPLHIVERGI